MSYGLGFNRRWFLQASGAVALGGALAACSSSSDSGSGPAAGAPSGTFAEPRSKLPARCRS